MRVGQSPLLEKLQEERHDLRMGLVDLVKQKKLVRLAAKRLGKLSAVLVSRISGRSADKLRNRMLLLKFAHVEGDHPLFAAEQERCKPLGRLGFSGAGHSGQNHRRKRLSLRFVVEFSSQKTRDPLLCRPLSDYAPVQDLRHDGDYPRSVYQQIFRGDRGDAAYERCQIVDLRLRLLFTLQDAAEGIQDRKDLVGLALRRDVAVTQIYRSTDKRGVSEVDPVIFPERLRCVLNYLEKLFAPRFIDLHDRKTALHRSIF